jgi:hypothetical protein
MESWARLGRDTQVGIGVQRQFSSFAIRICFVRLGLRPPLFSQFPMNIPRERCSSLARYDCVGLRCLESFVAWQPWVEERLIEMPVRVICLPASALWGI